MDQGAEPDPYAAWHTSQIAPGGRNVAGYTDPVSDRLLEAARVTLDVAERRDLYAQLGARFAQTAPSVVLLYPRRAYLVPAGLAGLDGGLLFGPSPASATSTSGASPADTSARPSAHPARPLPRPPHPSSLRQRPGRSQNGGVGVKP